MVAAGDGVRLGAGMPKALVPLAGRPMLSWALDAVRGAAVEAVVVAAPSSRVDDVRRVAGDARVVAGGASRQDSVVAALADVASDEIVLVHDAARPLTPSSLFDAVRAEVAATGAGVVPALAPPDTMKRLDGRTVVATVDRAELAAVQTPQGFLAGALRDALRSAEAVYTDDAAAFAAAGHPVVAVPGDPDAFKITTRWDLRRAEQLLAAPPVTRSGIGIDVHAIDPSRPLRLGGLDWPGEPGLAGHSDADVACHAIADALLSAAGLGDLGSRFGVDRPEEAGRSGTDFVVRTVALLAASGWAPVHVAVQIVGNRPRIAGRREAMQEALGEAVGAPVSVAGTTTDGLGLTGRGEGVAAVATALVSSAPSTRPLRSSP